MNEFIARLKAELWTLCKLELYSNQAIFTDQPIKKVMLCNKDVRNKVDEIAEMVRDELERER